MKPKTLSSCLATKERAIDYCRLDAKPARSESLVDPVMTGLEIRAHLRAIFRRKAACMASNTGTRNRVPSRMLAPQDAKLIVRCVMSALCSCLTTKTRPVTMAGRSMR